MATWVEQAEAADTWTCIDRELDNQDPAWAFDSTMISFDSTTHTFDEDD